MGNDTPAMEKVPGKKPTMPRPSPPITTGKRLFSRDTEERCSPEPSYLGAIALALFFGGLVCHAIFKALS